MAEPSVPKPSVCLKGRDGGASLHVPRRVEEKSSSDWCTKCLYMTTWYEVRSSSLSLNKCFQAKQICPGEVICALTSDIQNWPTLTQGSTHQSISTHGYKMMVISFRLMNRVQQFQTLLFFDAATFFSADRKQSEFTQVWILIYFSDFTKVFWKYNPKPVKLAHF